MTTRLGEIVEVLSKEIPFVMEELRVTVSEKDGLVHERALGCGGEEEERSLLSIAGKGCSCLDVRRLTKVKLYEYPILGNVDARWRLFEMWWKCRSALSGHVSSDVESLMRGIDAVAGSAWELRVEVRVAQSRGVGLQVSEQMSLDALLLEAYERTEQMRSELLWVTHGNGEVLLGLSGARGAREGWETLAESRSIGEGVVFVSREVAEKVQAAMEGVVGGELQVVDVLGESPGVLAVAAGLWEAGSRSAMGSLEAALDAARRVVS